MWGLATVRSPPKGKGVQSSLPTQSFESSEKSNSFASSEDYNSPDVESPRKEAKGKGVRYLEKRQKWVVEIRLPKTEEKLWLGTFSTEEEAQYAFDVGSTMFGIHSFELYFGWHPIYLQIPSIPTELPKREYTKEVRKVVKEFGRLARESRTISAAAVASTSTARGSSYPLTSYYGDVDLLQPMHEETGSSYQHASYHGNIDPLQPMHEETGVSYQHASYHGNIDPLQPMHEETGVSYQHANYHGNIDILQPMHEDMGLEYPPPGYYGDMDPLQPTHEEVGSNYPPASHNGNMDSLQPIHGGWHHVTHF